METMLILGLITAVVSAVAGLAQSGIANEQWKQNLNQSTQAQKDLMDYERDYNDPSKQMQRLQAAGLNPNLIYGTPTSGGLSGSAPSVSAPSNMNFTSLDVARDAASIAQTKRAESEIDLNNSAAAKNNAEARFYNTQADRYNEIVNQQIVESKQRVENLAKDLDVKDSDIRFKDAEAYLATAEAKYKEGLIDNLQFERARMIAQTNLFRSEKALNYERAKTEYSNRKKLAAETFYFTEAAGNQSQQGGYWYDMQRNAQLDGYLKQLQVSYESVMKSPVMTKAAKDAELARLRKEAAKEAARQGVEGSKVVQWVDQVFEWIGDVSDAATGVYFGTRIGKNFKK